MNENTAIFDGGIFFVLIHLKIQIYKFLIVATAYTNRVR